MGKITCIYYVDTQVEFIKLFFPPSQKQDQKSNQRADNSQSDFSVCGNSSIRLSCHWCRASLREACNWPTASQGFIASMATLLPYCLGKVKRRGRGEATFTQTLPLYYSSFVPECLQCAWGRTKCCLYVRMVVIGWGSRGDWGETGAIIALSGATHPATLWLYI